MKKIINTIKRRIVGFLLYCLPLPMLDGLRTIRKSEIYLFYRHYCFSSKGKVPFPNFILVDPGNICNLECPLCLTGTNRLNYRRQLMSLETFKTIIEKIPFLQRIGLYRWGEPFLNPEIFEMIKYASANGISVSLDTNLCLKKGEDFFDDIVKSGLVTLTVSLDGASQESYSKYRVNGDFNLVISNIRMLTRAKNKFNTDKPRIIWKFLVNKYNEHEINRARIMAKELGIEFLIAQMRLSDDIPDISLDSSLEQRKIDWLPKNKRYIAKCYLGEYSIPLYKGACPHLFNSLVVNPDGKVFPCCYLSDENNVFGDLLKESFEDIWNNDKFTYSRSLFVKRVYNGPKIETPCSKCILYRARKS